MRMHTNYDLTLPRVVGAGGGGSVGGGIIENYHSPYGSAPCGPGSGSCNRPMAMLKSQDCCVLSFAPGHDLSLEIFTFSALMPVLFFFSPLPFAPFFTSALLYFLPPQPPFFSLRNPLIHPLSIDS